MKHLNELKSDEKIPHVGWRQIPELNGKFYFTHSYFMPDSLIADSSILLNFGSKKIAVYLQKDNYYGVQFHPEKTYTLNKFFTSFQWLVRLYHTNFTKK